jgi:hypothetical protein
MKQLGKEEPQKPDLVLTTPSLEPSACEGAIDWISQDG